MLPFLKPKAISGVIMSTRKPDGGDDEDGLEGDDQALEACMDDLRKASEAKDIKAMAAAFRAAFDCLEIEPHDEAPHPHTYESSKE